MRTADHLKPWKASRASTAILGMSSHMMTSEARVSGSFGAINLQL